MFLFSERERSYSWDDSIDFEQLLQRNEMKWKRVRVYGIVDHVAAVGIRNETCKLKRTLVELNSRVKFDFTWLNMTELISLRILSRPSNSFLKNYTDWSISYLHDLLCTVSCFENCFISEKILAINFPRVFIISTMISFKIVFFGSHLRNKRDIRQNIDKNWNDSFSISILLTSSKLHFLTFRLRDH